MSENSLAFAAGGSRGKGRIALDRDNGALLLAHIPFPESTFSLRPIWVPKASETPQGHHLSGLSLISDEAGLIKCG